ncbi:AMP-dependent synthetase/ligase [Sporichthya polymorpha]|uniref:AMP-dependent synthetase/ligase n=1 Tax=Sporichthya polymorpha TaxID=35751 RepID=UPI000380A919|nr:AMP-dependent synthetase/ligase [Sporichthya polymorpha]
MTTTSGAALQATDLCEAFACTVAERPDEEAMRASDGSVSLTWSQVDAEVRRVAGGLAALGVTTGGTTCMMLANRYQAAVTDLATLHLGAVPVSLYNSTATSQLTYLLDDARCDVLVTETAFADKARTAIAATARKPKLVVIDGTGDEPDWTALTSMGDPLAPGVRPTLKADDVLTVVYTSGTTGVPKGAELTHDNILEQIRGLHSLGRLPMGGRSLSYLPFAHMGDRLCAYYMPIVSGSSITYHLNPKTAALLLPELQPTLYMAVPRIWNYVMGLAHAAIEASPQRAELEKALELGLRLHDDRLAGKEVDTALREEWLSYDEALDGLRRTLGLAAGELLFTGAAPLPPETLRFFAAIGVDLCECYGQSETAGIILCNPAGAARPVTNGLPLPGVEAKIADDGELLLKGPMVMKGYRGKPDLTAEAFDPDGWLRTGDIFVQDEAGYYRIVDRKKEILVSSTGKNVSPVLVENTLVANCPLIAPAVCIGDARPYVTALIALEPEGTAALTGEADPARNAANPLVRERIRDGIRSANEHLNAAEQVRRFLLVESTWLPGTDELTPTMKLRRKPIAEKYAKEIELLYGPPSDRVVEVVEPR